MQARSAMANTSFIMGIVSLVFIIIGMSFPMGAFGCIVALISRGKYEMETKAKLGFAFSLAGMIVGIGTIIFAVIFTQTPEFQELLTEIERAYGLI